MKAMNAEMLKKEIHGERPVLVEFWAPWCVYCRRITPVLKQLESKYEKQLTIAQINIDDEPALADREKIQVIPTLVLYQNGERLASIVNPGSKAVLDTFIQDNLGL